MLVPNSVPLPESLTRWQESHVLQEYELAELVRSARRPRGLITCG